MFKINLSLVSKKSFLVMILLTTVSMILLAQNKELRKEETTVITRNPDPIKYPEITYEEYRAQHPLSVQSFHQEINYVTNDERDNENFLILVDPSIQSSISSALTTYQNDLLNESLNSFLVIFSGSSAEDLKTIISNYYTTDNIIGSVLIGNIPSAWYEYEKQDSLGVPTGVWSNFPIDHFYSDLDGIWTDSDLDGKYDIHTGNVHPDIWLGRIKGDNLPISTKTEVEMINDYFARNHLFRSGMLDLPGTGLAYVDDDWSASGNSYQEALEYIYSNTELINESQATNGVDYMDNRLPANYEFIQVMVHSSTTHHGFKAVDGPDTTWTNVYNSDLVTIKPDAYFYNLFACSNCRYENTNCMGSIYLLDNNNCLNVIGTTKTGSMQYFADFYEPLSQNKTFGQALNEWWILHVDVPVGDYGQIHWYYGNLILGDPTLYIEYPENLEVSIWRGTVSGAWNLGSNWRNSILPNATKDVYIPSGTPNSPLISSENANCKSIDIEAGAILTINGRSLEVQEDVHIYGELVMDDNLSKLIVHNNLLWASGSSADITGALSEIIVYNYFCFLSGANVQIDQGDVRLMGSSNSAISSYEANCYLNNLRILKSGAQVDVSGEVSEVLNIHGDLYVNSTSTLTNSYESNDILVKGDFTCDGTLWLIYADLIFEGSIQSINTTSGDYFNDVTFNSSSYAQLQNDVLIKGDVEFDTGSLDANGYDIFMEGNWLINQSYPSSFTAGSGTVTFNGTVDQICNGNTFNILKLDKSSGELIIQDAGTSVVTCNSYDWTQGTITIDGGTFTINDLVDNGFYGTTQVISGTLNIFQDAAQYVNLNGSLIIYDGEVNVHGGDDTSYWPYSEDAYLYMEGGTLDFTDHSININTSYAFGHVISGGTIRATGDFTIERHDFHPTGGKIELYGSGGASIDLGDWGNYLHDLEIDKETTRSEDKDSKNISDNLAINKKKQSRRHDSPVYDNLRVVSVTVQSDLEIQGNLTISNGTYFINGHTVEVQEDVDIYGTLEMFHPLDHLDVTGDVDWNSGSSDLVSAGEISLEGDWYFHSGTTASLGVGNTVRIDGTGASQITIAEFDNASFGIIILDKTSGLTEQSTYYSAYMKVTGNLTINANNEFRTQNLTIDGDLFMDTDSELLIDWGQVNVNSDVECNGYLNIDDNDFTAYQAFVLNTAGEMTIDGGTFNSYKSYTGAYLTFAGTLNLLDGYFIVWDENVRFTTTPNIGNATIQLGRGLQATLANAFQPSSGTVQFIGNALSNIDVSNGNYFHNMIINKSTGTQICLMNDDLVINNDLILTSGKLLGSGHGITIVNDVIIESGGVLDPDDELLLVGGDWTNNQGSAGFIEGTGTVRFIGAADSYLMTDETFYNLEINKSGGQFTYLFINDNVTANISNDVNINNCSLRLNDNSILNIDHDLIISENTNLYATDTAPTAINLSGDWMNHNTTGYPWSYGFKPGLSTVIFNGTENQVISIDHTFGEFYNVIVDNSGTNPDYDCVILDDEIHVLGDFTVLDGTWKDSDVTTQEFHGNFEVNDGGWWLPLGHIKFKGSGDNTFQKSGSVVFNSVTIDKDVSRDRGASLMLLFDMYFFSVYQGDLTIENGTFDLNGNLCSCAGDVIINGGKLALDDNSRLRVGNGRALTVNNGGVLEAIGSAGNEADITAINAGNYHDVNIESGGQISAEYTTFQYMSSNGVYVKNGGIVYESHAFNNCTFQNSVSGGSLLRVENNQDLVASNVNFPPNTWSGSYNVFKDSDYGSIEFSLATGDFSGATYEYDLNDRIDWTGAPEIVVYPTYTLNFEDIEIGDSDTRGMTIENTGSGILEGTITTPNGYTVVEHNRSGSLGGNSRNTISYSIGSGITTTFVITFTPLLEQTYEGNVIITHNAAGPDETVHVIGVGVSPPPPGIYVDTNSLSFGDILIGHQDTLSFYMENTGGGNLIGSIITPEGYSVSEMFWRDNFTDDSGSRRIFEYNYRNTLTFNIPSGIGVDYNVTFEPSERQAYNGNIVITHNAGGGDEIISVEGNGVGAELTADPFSFEETLQEGNSTLDILTIGNIGNLDLNYNATIEYSTRNRNILIESGFEGSFPPYGWTTEIIYETGDWIQIGGYYHSGSYSALADWMDVDDARLITPFFTATDDCLLKYWIRSYDLPNYGGDFGVEVSTDGIDWTMIDTFGQNSLTETFTQKIISLASYAGSSIQIAFRAFNNLGGNGVIVDDVEITGNTGPTYTWLTLDGGTSASGTIPISSPDVNINVGFDSSWLADSTYSANIVISSNDPVLSIYSIPVTLIVGVSLIAPTNLTIEITGTNVVLNWDAVTGAISYKVYSSDDPYTAFGSWTLEQEITGTTWDEPIPAEKKFYYVTSVVDPVRNN